MKSGRFDPVLVQAGSLDTLRHERALEEQFLQDAGRRIDDVIGELVEKNSGWLTRIGYEVLFALYPLFVLFRIGKNFFYDTLLIMSSLWERIFTFPRRCSSCCGRGWW